MKGIFYGLGLGPGDPGLVTLKAYKILEEADVLCIPKSSVDKESLAYKIVRELNVGKFETMELLFPMIKDSLLLKESWVAAGERIAERLAQGLRVAFVTIGDPMFYSTYGYISKYLMTNYPEFERITVPGITAMTAAASLIGVPLSEGEESLVVLQGSYGLDNLEDTLKNYDNIVLMKINRDISHVADSLKRLGMEKNAVLVSRCGYANQFITMDLDSIKGEPLDYMSLIIIKKNGFN
ncbi:MAG: precorrin-2 C(20)-methyltransferase [Peptococcaceae bacterium]|nr:precorrin-2 C(20)-methyltransferase [Peptococcaceae bacterium]